MKLSKKKEELLSLRLRSLFDGHVTEITRLEGDAIAESNRRGLTGSGYPFAAIRNIYFGKMDQSLGDRIKIYLDVLAPKNLPFSDKAKKNINEHIKVNLMEYSTHMLSRFTGYNNWIHSETQIANDIESKINSLSDEALRQLSIEQGTRNLQPKFDRMKKRFIWWIKNHPIFSIVLFIIFLVSGIFTFIIRIKELLALITGTNGL